MAKAGTMPHSWRCLPEICTADLTSVLALFGQVNGIHSWAGQVCDRREATPMGPPESTPPFSYCEEVGTARLATFDGDTTSFDLGQPLVSFSPPFDASPLSAGRGGQLTLQEDGGTASASPSCTVHAQSGSDVRLRGSRTSLRALAASGSPALLETLPESPFSAYAVAKGGAQATAPEESTWSTACFAALLTPPFLEGRLIASQAHAEHNTAAVIRVGTSEASRGEERHACMEVGDC